MPYPATLQTNPKCIFFTDFDGTITLTDSNDWLTDHFGFGEKLRRQGNLDVLENRKTFRDSFKEMTDSIQTPFSECLQALCENITLDPHFKEFYQWARTENVPVIVLSSGMTPIIRGLLVHVLGSEANDLEIVSNEMVERSGMSKDEEGGWEISFHDESGFGHDKSLTIRPYAKHFADRPEEPRPTLLYAGDGVSDLSAARETDLLFAKEGRDLIKYCDREGIPYTTFSDWRSILQTTKDIVDGKVTAKEVAAKGNQNFTPNENMTRTVK